MDYVNYNQNFYQILSICRSLLQNVINIKYLATFLCSKKLMYKSALRNGNLNINLYTEGITGYESISLGELI